MRTYNRFSTALLIDKGACNLLPIARELLKAIESVWYESESSSSVEEDSAVRLIVHQIAHLTGQSGMSQEDYVETVQDCTDRREEPPLKEGVLPRQEYLQSLQISVEEAASLLYPGLTLDTALPQDWVDECSRERAWDPRGAVVWLYDSSIGGRPAPLTIEARREIDRLYPDFLEEK